MTGRPAPHVAPGVHAMLPFLIAHACLGMFAAAVAMVASFGRTHFEDTVSVSSSLAALICGAPLLGAAFALFAVEGLAPRRLFLNRPPRRQAQILQGLFAGAAGLGLLTIAAPFTDGLINDVLLAGSAGAAGTFAVLSGQPRHRAGQCPGCGYQRRDTAPQCPECGF